MTATLLKWKLFAGGLIILGALVGAVGLSMKNIFIVAIGGGIMWIGLDILDWEE